MAAPSCSFDPNATEVIITREVGSGGGGRSSPPPPLVFIPRRASLRRQVLESNLTRRVCSSTTDARPKPPSINNDMQYRTSTENLVQTDNDDEKILHKFSRRPPDVRNSPVRFLLSFVNRQKLDKKLESNRSFARLDIQKTPPKSATDNNKENGRVSIATNKRRNTRMKDVAVVTSTTQSQPSRFSRIWKNSKKLKYEPDPNELQFSDLELDDDKDESLSGPPPKRGKNFNEAENDGPKKLKPQPPPAPVLQRKHYWTRLNSCLSTT